MRNDLNKAFTLVELIVVITILAILGTIAFLSLQGYSADARNSKRVDNLSTISKEIAAKNAQGQSLLSFVSTGSNNLSPANYGGTGAIANTDYKAGPIAYSVLGAKQADFQDPLTNSAYVIGATTKIGGKYEISSIYENGTTKTAQVVGNGYTPRSILPIITAITGSGTTTFTISTSDVNKFKVGDTLTGGTTGGATITSISGDGLTITVNTAISGTGRSLAANESAGLIGASGALSTAVTDGGISLPY